MTYQAETLETVESEYVGNTCKAHGCTKPNRDPETGYYGHGYGAGYCPAHYRQFRRTGSPYTARELASRGLFDAALRYAEYPVHNGTADLCWAAVKFACAERNRPSLLPERPTDDRLVDSPFAGELCRAALTMADTDSDPDADLKFQEHLDALVLEAKTYAHSFVPYGPKNPIARRARRNS